LAQLLQVLLLPFLQDLTPGDRQIALEFIKAHWGQSRQYSGPLSTVTSFAAALKGIACIPAAQPSAAASEQHISSAGEGSSQHVEQAAPQLYRPGQLFDPSVPLFAAVKLIMAQAQGAAAAAAAGSAPVLFPADPYNRDDWLRFLRDLGLQHRVTKETFLQLAQHVAQQAAALASSTQPTGTQPAGTTAGSSQGASSAATAAAAGTAAGAAAGYLDVTGADAAQLQVVEAAAYALMMHLRSHWTGLGQDRPFWQALAAVPFWPATLGVPGRY
jgi:hypothetical protein